jgi:F-type H+-transporting ATPase subunit b
MSVGSEAGSMKRLDKIMWLLFYFLAGIISFHLSGQDVWAAENAGSWRSTYDIVFKWINFIILAFVLVKFGKAPLMNFLRGKKENLSREIKQIENKKAELKGKIKETSKILDESEVRFAEIKERIVRQGEQKKEAIIQTAQNQSKTMLEEAKRRIDTHFIQAKNTFRVEMIDMAIDLAMERFPKEITAEDNEKLTVEYLTLVK